MTSPLHDFFRTVITSVPRDEHADGHIGHICMAIRPKDRKEWHEHFLPYPNQIDEAVAFAEKMKGEFNVYFSSYLFSRPNSQKEFVLPSRTVWVDLDGAKLDDCPIPPSVVVETSPGHHQGYWLLDNALVPDAHEVLSRRLTYAIRGADRTGWTLGHKMRVPDTFNYKRDTPALIHVVKLTDTKYETSRIEMFPDPPALVHTRDQEWINNEVTTPLIGPEELLASLANKLPASVIDNYHKPDPKDRSGKLWHLMLSCFRAGCTREEVWWLAKHSANNKFSVLRFNGERDLKRDVASAEQAAKAEALNIRGAIASTRKVKMTAAEKNRMICKIVLDDMQNYGEFVHATNGRKFYLLKEVGRPIPVVTKGTELSSLLSTKYGLNATEKEHAFVVAEIQANTQNMEKNWTSAALTFFNKDRNEVLLHTGRRDVLRITPEQITYVPNGAFGILFQWDAMTDSFAPNLSSSLDWGTKLFGPSMDNIVTYTRAQGMALLKVWFIFMLLRNQASSRPILALFAAPGCLSGETKIRTRRPGPNKNFTREYTIAHLYARQEGRGDRRWRGDYTVRVPSLKEDEVAHREIDRIVYSGIKETYVLKVEGREPFRATADHRFLTRDGYKKLSELKVGNLVVVQGEPTPSRGRKKWTRRVITVPDHPYARSKKVNGYGPYKTILYPRAVLEAEMNNMSVQDYIQALGRERIDDLQFLPADVHIHHRDHNPENDTLGNLQPMTKVEHDRLHGYENVHHLGKNGGHFQTATARIESITYYGPEPTYDITMADQEAPNFLVNGVVTHNSGKSALFRRVYRLLYGTRKFLSAITTPDNFDQELLADPFVVFDNVDSSPGWLPDRLALSASPSDFVKRELYTDLDSIRVQRQAMIGLTAHNPRFGRADVIDRLLVLNFTRFEDSQFKDESEMVEAVTRQRNDMWGSIIQDVQKVLQVDPSTLSKSPRMRVQDFSTFGWRIAHGLGCVDDFAAALHVTVQDQTKFVLEEDSVLIAAIQSLLSRRSKKNGHLEHWQSITSLWVELEAVSGDPMVFRRTYSSAPVLGRHLMTTQHTLKNLFGIKWRLGMDGTREWAIETHAKGLEMPAETTAN